MHSDRSVFVIKKPNPLSAMQFFVRSLLFCVMLGAASATSFYAVDENDPATVAIVHRPGLDAQIAGMHPNGMLFEKPTSMSSVRLASGNLVDALTDHGVDVVTVTDVLIAMCASKRFGRDVEKLALDSIVYDFNSTSGDLNADDLYFLSDEYKVQVVSNMDCRDVVDAIVSRPRVHLTKATANSAVTTASVSLLPLGNLVFTRDQQITTAGGVVMGRMASSQRRFEVDIMRLVFEFLGADVIGTIPQGETLEGGDFFPLGHRGLAMLGTGLRTTAGAAQHMLKHHWFHAPRVAIVKDLYDRSQDRMHLDTVLGVVNEDVVVLEASLMSSDPHNPHLRLVDVYETTHAGDYELVDANIPLYDFLVSEGFRVIPVQPRDQLAYMINFLNLGTNPNTGRSRLLSVHPGLADLLADEDVDVYYVEFEGVKAMYGAAHCSTQVHRGILSSVM